MTTRPQEPALAYPAGKMDDTEVGGPSFFTGIVALTSVRIPLAEFAGIDLGALTEVALLLDQTPQGALFVGDVEFVAG